VKVEAKPLSSYGLTIIHQYESQPLENVSFYIYRVADSLEGEWDVEFKDCKLQLSELENNSHASIWNSMAQNLTAYTKEHKLNYFQLQKTNSQGFIKCSLAKGLYLIVGDILRQEEKEYRVSPFLVWIDKDMQIYTKTKKEIDVSVLIDNKSIGNNPSNNSEGKIIDKNAENREVEKEKLPKTGQLWWPVPFMACGGVLLFSCGWWGYYGEKKEY
jgi:hypothetical protein